MGRMPCGCWTWETSGGDGEVELCDKHQAEYEEEKTMAKCHKCGKHLDEDDVVWIDPISTLATMMGEPFCQGCAPAEKFPLCVSCGGLIEDYDMLEMHEGKAYHSGCFDLDARGVKP